jgi:hypothetical protein
VFLSILQLYYKRTTNCQGGTTSFFEFLKGGSVIFIETLELKDVGGNRPSQQRIPASQFLEAGFDCEMARQLENLNPALFFILLGSA